MSNQKLLSIIIPTYNMERYLSRCLDSLVNAKEVLPLLEILVINDGSKDKSSQIAHRYQERYPDSIIVIDKENGNYGSCINRGLKEATGKYVKILDADDWFDTDALNEYTKILLEVNVDLIITDVIVVNEEKVIMRKFTYDIPTGKTLDFSEYCIKPTFSKMGMHAVTYRTTLLHEINYFQTEGISYTDREWIFIPMNYVKTFFYYKKTIYIYLTGRNGQTMSPEIINKSISQYIKLAKSLIHSYGEHTISNDKVRRYLQSQLNAILILIYKKILLKGVGNLSMLEELENTLKTNEELYTITGNYVVSKKLPYKMVKHYRIKHTQAPWTIRILQRIWDAFTGNIL